jgi:ABC-type multidrug transport system ATPase subunit
MDEAARCDEVVLVRGGRVLAQTTPQGLLDATGTGDADTAFLRHDPRSIVLMLVAPSLLIVASLTLRRRTR